MPLPSASSLFGDDGDESFDYVSPFQSAEFAAPPKPVASDSGGFLPSAQITQQSTAKKFDFLFCDGCELEFHTPQQFESHQASHVSCEHEGCNFNAPRRLLKEHMLIHTYGCRTQTPEELAAYIKARKALYPTDAAVKKKVEREKQQLERGDFLPKPYGKRSKHHQHDPQHKKNKRAKYVDNFTPASVTPTPTTMPAQKAAVSDPDSSPSPVTAKGGLSILASYSSDSESEEETEPAALMPTTSAIESESHTDSQTSSSQCAATAPTTPNLASLGPSLPTCSNAPIRTASSTSPSSPSAFAGGSAPPTCASHTTASSPSFPASDGVWTPSVGPTSSSSPYTTPPVPTSAVPTASTSHTTPPVPTSAVPTASTRHAPSAGPTSSHTASSTAAPSTASVVAAITAATKKDASTRATNQFTRPCKFFARGKCPYDNCTFLHVERKVQTKTTPQKKREPKFTRPTRPSLLAKLLEKEHVREQRLLLQCFRYLVTNNFKVPS